MRKIGSSTFTCVVVVCANVSLPAVTLIRSFSAQFLKKAWVNVVAHRKNAFFAITRQVYNGFCSSWYQIAQWKKLFDIGINI